MRAGGGGRGRAQVKGHEDQHDGADTGEDGGDGDGASRVLRAQPASVRAAVPALIAARAEDAMVALLARGVAVLCAAPARGLAPGTRDSHHGRSVQVDGCRVALHERAGRVDAFWPIVATRDIDETRIVAFHGDAHVVAVAEHAVRRGLKRLHLDLRLTHVARASLGRAVAHAVRSCGARLAACGVVVVLVAVDALFSPEPRRGRQRGRSRGRKGGRRTPRRWRRRWRWARRRR